MSGPEASRPPAAWTSTPMGNLRHTAVFLLQSAAAGLAAAFVVVLLFPGLLPGQHPLRERGSQPGSYAEAVAATAPAVVNLVGRPAAPAGFAEQQSAGSLGSAVVMDDQGHVITNHHVIAGMRDLQVMLVDGRSAEAQLVGTDPDTDIALLKAELPDLPEIRVGRSDQLRVGDVVLAIGNPFSIGQTVTQGIVSGTGRGQLGLSQFENFIQTDAAINVGNSGGALVNARGELVGINTAFFSRRLDSEGIGFAIPINLVRGVMQDLQEYGRVIRGWLGVSTQTLTPDQTRALGLPQPYGIILTTVQPDSPADRAGLRPNDVITHVNGEPVLVWQDALRSIAAMRPGSTVTLAGSRGGRSFKVEAEVTERPSRL